MNDASTMTFDEYTAAVAPETLRIERMLPGPIERVWAYLVEPDKRAMWFCGGPMAQRAGGKADLVFRNSTLSHDDAPPPPNYADKGAEFHMASVVTACEPPNRLSFTFGADDNASEATFELTPKGDKVHLVVTHRRVTTQEGRISISTGWHSHLSLLEARLAGTPPPKFWETFTRLEAIYRARVAS